MRQEEINMSDPEKRANPNPAENLGKMFESFGAALSKIFDDPDLKDKAKDFGQSAAASAKTFAGRFKDEDVKAGFRDVGKAAETFGKSVADQFKSDKGAKS
jgi:[ribosomal protein S5]-alanine N-acetyltransferase